MMPRRWHHGHSLGAGALIGMGVVSYHIYILLAVAFLLGIVAAVFLLNGMRLIHWVQNEVEARRPIPWQ